MGGARGGAGCYPSSVRSFFFISRKVLAWAMASGLAVAIWAIMFGQVRSWLVALLLLYFPCRWFAGVKQRRRDAWLNYL